MRNAIHQSIAACARLLDPERYLLGIVRNVAAKIEGECVAAALLSLRLQMRDRMLALLAVEQAAV